MWVYGFHWVKFDTEKEPVKKALLCVRACPDEAAVAAVNSYGDVFHWCADHAKDPTCGGVPQHPEESK
jgi:hypothetical protein